MSLGAARYRAPRPAWADPEEHHEVTERLRSRVWWDRSNTVGRRLRGIRRDVRRAKPAIWHHIEQEDWCLWVFHGSALVPSWLRDGAEKEWLRLRSLWILGEVEVCPVFGVPTELCWAMQVLGTTLHVMHSEKRRQFSGRGLRVFIDESDAVHCCEHVFDGAL